MVLYIIDGRSRGAINVKTTYIEIQNRKSNDHAETSNRVHA